MDDYTNPLGLPGALQVRECSPELFVEFATPCGGSSRLPLDINSPTDFGDWCRDYGNYWLAKDDTQPLFRFLIGVYQYGQAINWLGSSQAVYYSSLTSMILHITAAAEMQGQAFSPRWLLPPLYSHIPRLQLSQRNYATGRLLTGIANLLQIHYYRKQTSHIGHSKARTERFGEREVSHTTADVIKTITSFIPIHVYPRAMMASVNEVLAAEHLK